MWRDSQVVTTAYQGRNSLVDTERVSCLMFQEPLGLCKRIQCLFGVEEQPSRFGIAEGGRQ